MSGGTEAQAKVYAAYSLIQAGNLTGAERLLKDALAADPEHGRAHALMAFVLYRLGRYKLALQAADASLAQDPNAEAMRYRALILAALNRRKAALEAIEAAVRLDPEDAWCAMTKGALLEGAKRYAEAEAGFRQACALSPGSDDLRGMLGRYFLRRRNLPAAERIAAELDPHTDADSALLLRGEVAMRRSRTDEARDIALWILSKNATDVGALRLLTQVKASRSPVLGLWWRYSMFMATQPWWLRTLVIVPVALVLMIFVKYLWLALFVYLRVGARIFQTMVQRELRGVTLRKNF